MRKILLIALPVLAASSLAHAGPANYNDAGCGLGSMIWPKNTKGQQIIAATTNGIGSQTSAISSATSDCREGAGMARLRRERKAFVAANFRQLSRELALGQGEYAASFASLMGCEEKGASRLLNLTKTRFSEIFDESMTPASFLKAVEKEVEVQPELSSSCRA